MSLHCLSGRLHEIQNRSRPAALEPYSSQNLPTNVPAETGSQRESFERPGNTVIDMVSLKAHNSPETSMDSKSTMKPAMPMGTAGEVVAEGNAGASSTWLLAARSFAQPSSKTLGTNKLSICWCSVCVSSMPLNSELVKTPCHTGFQASSPSLSKLQYQRSISGALCLLRLLGFFSQHAAELLIDKACGLATCRVWFEPALSHACCSCLLTSSLVAKIL